MSLGFGYSTTQNNGNLLSQTITRTSPSFSATQNYSYTDGVNRLTAASEGSNWSQPYVYDNVGNRAVQAGTGNRVVVSNYTPQTSGTTVPYDASNHWTVTSPPPYDGAGNMTAVGTMTMGYDAESRLTSWTDSSPSESITLTYDGLGRRVTKVSSVTGTTIYVYDPAGNLAAEYGGAAASASATLYLTQDHLGSTRLVTNAAGSVVGCHDYLPFGEEIPASWGSRPSSCYGQTDTTVKFTGQERDAETAADGSGLTGFDNFWARMMAGSQGRFLSPDPDNAGADSTNPQSWNMYSYVLNNPLKFIDPTGMTCVYNDGDPDNPVGDNGDGQGCAGVGVAAGDPNNVEQTLNPTNYINQTVNDQQGSWLDYFATSTLGGVGLNDWGRPAIFNPNLTSAPILVYVRPGSAISQKPRRKPGFLDYAACTLSPHDFVQLMQGGRSSPSDPLVGNNNAVPAGPIDVNKRGTSAPKGSTNYVSTNGQNYAQSSALLATTGSNWAADCLPLVGK